MQTSKFDIIVGRHHSGRTRQALTMAAHKAQIEKKSFVVFGPSEKYVHDMARETAELFQVEYLVENYLKMMVMPYGTNNEEYVACVLADEIPLSAQSQEHVRQLIRSLSNYELDTSISMPSLVGMRDDLRLSTEARALINCTPIGSRIHLATVEHDEKTSRPKMKLELVGHRLPFNI